MPELRAKAADRLTSRPRLNCRIYLYLNETFLADGPPRICSSRGPEPLVVIRAFTSPDDRQGIVGPCVVMKGWIGVGEVSVMPSARRASLLPFTGLFGQLNYLRFYGG